MASSIPNPADAASPMLGLRLPTDPRWAQVVAGNLDEILTDHAYCEQKAASNAISLIIAFPEKAELVQTMAQLAQEEMEHFERVHRLLLNRGLTLGRERKDPYVNDLYAFIRKGVKREDLLTDRLLFAAMVEARSCERFRVLAAELPDPELKAFYHELMASEAGHYATFLRLAKLYQDPQVVKARWQQWLDHEAAVIRSYGTQPTMHG